MRCQMFEANATKTGINPAEAFISYDAHVKNNHMMIWDLKYQIFKNRNYPTTNGCFSYDKHAFEPVLWQKII